MKNIDYRSLPKLRDSLGHVYIEHAKVDKEARSIAFHDDEGTTNVPVAATTLLMLGPGTSITHAAVNTLAESGCQVIWCGEDGVRFYAHGVGETRKAYKLERQARLWADPDSHMRVVRAMYTMRLGLKRDDLRTLQQLRGMEGVRVRDSYAAASRETGVPWHGRQYNRQNWNASDDVNKALSSANACLYGLVHSAIVAGGYSTGLGFIHSGHQRSFVFDIADLYKADLTIPAAFETVAEGPDHLERAVRTRCRENFHKSKLLARILPDINRLLEVGEDEDAPTLAPDDEDKAPNYLPSYWETPSTTKEDTTGKEASP